MRLSGLPIHYICLEATFKLTVILMSNQVIHENYFLCEIPRGREIIFLLGRYLNLCLWTWFPKGLLLLLSCSTLIFLIGFLGPTAEGQIDIQQATVIRQQQLRSLINSWSLCPSEISTMWLNVINSNISIAWLPSPAAIMVTVGQA